MPPEPVKPNTAITEVGNNSYASADIPLSGGGSKPTFSDAGGSEASLEFDPRTGKPVGAQEAPKVEGAEPPAAEGEPEAAPPAAEKVEPAEKLPDFDPANEEVRAKYDQRYFNEEGKLNLGSLTTEFWSNAKDGVPGTLNEGTYKYLEETLGITKEAAQAIEKGLVADRKADNSAFFNKVGGKARWDAALAWGRTNYTKDQVARFNSALSGSDQVARDEAVDALMGRFERVSPRQGARRGPPRRAAAPERSATAQAAPGTGAGGGAAPYATQAAYAEAFTKALQGEKSAKTPAEKRAAAAARDKVREDGKASQRFWK